MRRKSRTPLPLLTLVFVLLLEPTLSQLGSLGGSPKLSSDDADAAPVSDDLSNFFSRQGGGGKAFEGGGTQRPLAGGGRPTLSADEQHVGKLPVGGAGGGGAGGRGTPEKPLDDGKEALREMLMKQMEAQVCTPPRVVRHARH
eukprot:2682880-Rhodomonas_salina.1